MKMEIFKPGNMTKNEVKRELVGFKVHCDKCNCFFAIPIEYTHKITTMGFWEYAWNCPWCGAKHQTGQGGDNGKTEYVYE